MKSEPEVFSFGDLLLSPERTTFWDGVRNYQARNMLRDEMRPGDGVLFYHSNAEPPAIVGVCEVTAAGTPDPTQFDPAHDHHDPASTPDAPRWYGVHLRAVAALESPLSLPVLRAAPGFEGMELLRKGSRLSVQPVAAHHWDAVCRAGGVPSWVTGER